MSIEEVGIPEGVKEVVGQRLSALPDACDAVLHGAAVAGQDFELDVIVAVTGDTEEQVIDALEAARVAGLLDELGGAPVRYRFSHALVQQTLLDEIPTARRLRFHRAIAEAIERLRADHLDRYRAALAAPLVRGRNRTARALVASVAAADRALAQFADREALQWLTQAADLFDDADASATTRIDVMTMTGRHCGASATRAIARCCSKRADSPSSIGDAPRMATAALAERARLAERHHRHRRRARRRARGRRLRVGRRRREHARHLARASPRSKAVRAAIPASAWRSVMRRWRSRMPGTIPTRSPMCSVAPQRDPEPRNDRPAARSTTSSSPRLADELGDPNLRFRRAGVRVLLALPGVRPRGRAGTVQEGAEISGSLAQPQFEWIADVGGCRAGPARRRPRGAPSGLVEHSRRDRHRRRAFRMRSSSTQSCAPVRSLTGPTRATLPEVAGAVRERPSALSEHPLDAGPDGVSRPRENRSGPAEVVDELGVSPYAPWSELGGTPDSALAYAAAFAASRQHSASNRNGRGSCTSYMDPWRGQLFGNIIYRGPTEVYMAGIAPLADHADDLDELLDTGLRLCEEMRSPLLAMYARMFRRVRPTCPQSSGRSRPRVTSR